MDLAPGLADGDDDTQLTPEEVDAIVADNGYAMATDVFSGSYSDLTGTPTLFSGSYTDLTDQPELFDGAFTSLTENVFNTSEIASSYPGLLA